MYIDDMNVLPKMTLPGYIVLMPSTQYSGTREVLFSIVKASSEKGTAMVIVLPK